MCLMNTVFHPTMQKCVATQCVYLLTGSRPSSFFLHAQVLLLCAFSSHSCKVAVQTWPQRRVKASVNGYIYQRRWPAWVSTNLVLGWCEKHSREQFCQTTATENCGFESSLFTLESLHKPLRYCVDQPHSRSLLITLKTILPHLIVCIETQSGVVV